MQVYDMKWALDSSFAFATELNQYIDTMKPWKLDPAIEAERIMLDHILSTIMIGLAHIAYNLSPFFEEKMRELLERIGVGKWWDMGNGFIVKEKGEPLYMRLDTVQKSQ